MTICPSGIGPSARAASDPLHFAPVKPLARDESEDTPAQDPRGFWRRLFSSVRPSVSVEKDPKTGQRVGTVSIKGGTDF